MIDVMMSFFLGIGMDASVTPLRHGGYSLVQTTDFFYPLVDDPYMMVSNAYILTEYQPVDYGVI